MARILIIDDNAVDRKLARILLGVNGYAILEVASAEEGLRVARSLPPDLILMDITMPKMDGITATRLLKSDPATANIKIVALTACAMPGDREKFKAAGCDGYISKPVSVDKFLDEIKMMLGNCVPV